MVELAGYRRRADELLTPDERDAIIDLVAYEPTCGELIPGTGGLRKVRIGLGGRGKRGGARVVYYLHNFEIPLHLIALYAKNEKGDLSAREKKEFAGLVKEIVKQWRRN